MAVATIEEYFAAVRSFADDFVRRDDDCFEAFIMGLSGNAEAEACVTLRLEVATRTELDTKRPFLELGYFPDPDEMRRLAWWLFYSDLVCAYENVRIEGACEPYRRDQPLFKGAPRLFDRIRRRPADKGAGSPDYELVDEAATRCVDESEVFAVDPGFARLPSDLAPRIPAWARSVFPEAPRFLRLDPRFWFAAQPLMRMEEAALVPANPSWMKSLALFPGMKEFASYILEDYDPKSDMAQYRDFHIRDVRRLEVAAQRRSADYLTMMLEELPRADDPNGLMVGRCIHLDTRAPIGTPITEACLQHLDLAINVYGGRDREKRMNDSLQNGRVCDATYRTHLYRIENIPFAALFTFAGMFFKSQLLVQEWLTDIGMIS